MGHYVSIRGWMDCPESQIDRIKVIIASFERRADVYSLSIEGAELYNRGWVIPDSHINWTRYLFYGADIRIQCLNFIKDQIIELSKEILEQDGGDIDRINGVFDLEDETGEFQRTWKVASGVFTEEQGKR